MHLKMQMTAVQTIILQSIIHGDHALLEEGKFYKSGGCLSCQEKVEAQMHYHRSEHWIIVSGTATVVIDGQESLVSSNESVFGKNGLGTASPTMAK